MDFLQDQGIRVQVVPGTCISFPFLPVLTFSISKSCFVKEDH